MKCLTHHDLYDKKNHGKFQGQKIHQKKVFQILPTLVVVVESFFTSANFDNLSKIEFVFCHEILGKKTLYFNKIW
jgi:hypothetical protein